MLSVLYSARIYQPDCRHSTSFGFRTAARPRTFERSRFVVNEEPQLLLNRNRLQTGTASLGQNPPKSISMLFYDWIQES